MCIRVKISSHNYEDTFTHKDNRIVTTLIGRKETNNMSENLKLKGGDASLSSLEEMLSKLSNEEILDLLAESDSVLWCERFRTLRGEPFSLRERKHLWDVYRDKSKKIVLLKSRQIRHRGNGVDRKPHSQFPVYTSIHNSITSTATNTTGTAFRKDSSVTCYQ